ncbi:MAG TPA: Ig-like domain-containing protein, partial [Gemmatimonadaceae bacterium]|nr:Ig-like domain-containing protein [Gemmatimonadaceae bacterium]
MRRLAFRVVSSLLLGIVAVSCSDSPTSLNRTALHVALLPQFSARAQAIYKSLSAFAVTLDNVHVVVRVEASGDALGPVLKDTTIAFPATADQVTIDLELDIQGTQQNVVATVELREGTTAYFSGTQDFAAKQGQTATAPQPVELGYVGPGSSAALIVLAPQPATLAPSTTFQFTANVFDAAEHSITALPLTWATLDSSIATVSQTGLVTSTGRSGQTTLIVTGLNGVIARGTVNVQPV